MAKLCHRPQEFEKELEWQGVCRSLWCPQIGSRELVGHRHIPADTATKNLQLKAPGHACTVDALIGAICLKEESGVPLVHTLTLLWNTYMLYGNIKIFVFLDHVGLQA